MAFNVVGESLEDLPTQRMYQQPTIFNDRWVFYQFCPRRLPSLLNKIIEEEIIMMLIAKVLTAPVSYLAFQTAVITKTWKAPDVRRMKNLKRKNETEHIFNCRYGRDAWGFKWMVILYNSELDFDSTSKSQWYKSANTWLSSREIFVLIVSLSFFSVSWTHIRHLKNDVRDVKDWKFHWVNLDDIVDFYHPKIGISRIYSLC